jgi:hypothetical protein
MASPSAYAGSPFSAYNLCNVARSITSTDPSPQPSRRSPSGTSVRGEICAENLKATPKLKEDAATLIELHNTGSPIAEDVQRRLLPKGGAAECAARFGWCAL